MNLFCSTVLFVAVVACAQAVDVSTTGRLSIDKSEDLNSRVGIAGGCNVNICFVLGGGSSLTRFDLHRQFAFIMSTVPSINLIYPVKIAAAQYGTPILSDQPLTVGFGNLIGQFMNPAPNPPPWRTSTFINRMSYCTGQLPTSRRDEVNMIVVFGGGDAVIRSGDISHANSFRRVGGEVCAVGDGIANNHELLAIAGGDSNRVLNLNSNYYPEFRKIIDDLVADTC